MLNCLFCHSELDPLKKENNYYYIFCKSFSCKDKNVKCMFYFRNEKYSLRGFTFDQSYNNKTYTCAYRHDKMFLVGDSASNDIELSLTSPFQLILTPDNFQKRFPLLLTYNF